MKNKVDYSLLLGGMKWSFSSINCYNNCPHCFYLTYIAKQKKEQNAFAQWGTLGHSLLERYYKGELELWDLSQKYDEEYASKVSLEFPYNRYVDLGESYYLAGKKYFDNFQGDFENCEILGVEQYIEIEIDGYPFIGYIDLLVRTPDGIIVCDHKSKSGFKGKEKQEYLRQLYLYSFYVKQMYGEYPYKLMFNMFRANTWEEELFDYKALMQAKEWFVETIQKIYLEKDFKDKIALDYKTKGKLLKEFKKDDFFCNELCSTPCLRSRRHQHRWKPKRGDASK